MTNDCGKYDVLLTQYDASQILGISEKEVREPVENGTFTLCNVDMRGKYKVSMREVNRLKFKLEIKKEKTGGS